MLTVSKLTGTAGAILAYAEGRSERLRGDYYLDPQEASPERAAVAWSPELQGNLQAGLAGPVDREAFERVMSGRDPQTGEQVITAHLRRRRDLAEPETRDAAYAHAEALGLPSRRHRPLTHDQAAALQAAGTAEEARAVLRGARQSQDSAVAGEAATHRVSGIDLTFSAPKSVSLLWGLTTDPELRTGLEQAHTRAARRALRELEERALVGRARVDGRRVRVPLRWVGIEAVHTTARLAEVTAREGRPPDPDLHTHTVVANMGWDQAAGKWRAVDAGTLLHVRSLGDGVYLTELSAQLRDLGLRIVPNTGRDGRYIELAGIQPAWSEAFSARAHEVRRARELLGIETDVPARTLAAATRRGKGEETTEDHTQAWRNHLRAQFGTQALDAVDQVAAQPVVLEEPQPLAERERELLERFFSPEGLTAHEASHTQVAVEATLWHLNGGRLSSEEMGALMPRVLAGGRLVLLDDGRYTTQDLLREELSVQAFGRWLLHARPAHVAADPVQIETAVAKMERETGVSLDPEQRAAVQLLTDPGRRLRLMGGPAGSGKTTTLRAAREVWEAQGRQVVVLSVAAQTAQRTAREIGAAQGMTFEEFARRRAGGARAEISDRDLRRLAVVVDEAAMADTPRLHSLLRLAGDAGGGASLVLLGDERQLQSVGAGGGWLRLKRHAQADGAYCELTQVHRQREQWERRALDELRGGRGPEAIAAYLVHDRIQITDTRAEARQLVAEAWNRARLAGQGKSGRPISDYVMVAATREDTAVLNQWAQGLRRQEGELGPGLQVHDREGRREVFQGDRVRLEERLDPDHPNGIRGTVTEISTEGEGGLRIRWDTGHPETLYRPHEHEAAGAGGQPLQLDYAGTTQRSQGVTAEQAFVLPAPQQGLEALYSAFSRARGETTVVLDRRTWGEHRSDLGPQGRETLDQAELVARLAARASHSELKRGALDSPTTTPARDGRGARVTAAQEKRAAYGRTVDQAAATAAARPRPQRQHGDRDHDRYAREAHERQQAARQRGPHIGY